MSTTPEALAPCPLCGAEKGYNLDEGSTYRWWSVKCAACGQEVSEARATYPAETTPRTDRADEAWNDAGKHAQALRTERDQLRAEVDALRADAERWQAIETAPDDFQQILVWGKWLAHPFSVRRTNGGWVTPGRVLVTLEDVTHWMPLPAPPAA